VTQGMKVSWFQKLESLGYLAVKCSIPGRDKNLTVSIFYIADAQAQLPGMKANSKWKGRPLPMM